MMNPETKERLRTLLLVAGGALVGGSVGGMRGGARIMKALPHNNEARTGASILRAGHDMALGTAVGAGSGIVADHLKHKNAEDYTAGFIYKAASIFGTDSPALDMLGAAPVVGPAAVGTIRGVGQGDSLSRAGKGVVGGTLGATAGGVTGITIGSILGIFAEIASKNPKAAQAISKVTNKLQNKYQFNNLATLSGAAGGITGTAAGGVVGTRAATRD